MSLDGGGENLFLIGILIRILKSIVFSTPEMVWCRSMVAARICVVEEDER